MLQKCGHISDWIVSKSVFKAVRNKLTELGMLVFERNKTSHYLRHSATEP